MKSPAIGLMASAMTAAIFAACGNDNGERTISSSVVGSLICYQNVDTWYTALAAEKNGMSLPDSGTGPDPYPGWTVFPGDHVTELESHLVDEQPGLVTVTGSVRKVRITSGINGGNSCWLYDGENQMGPLFE